MRRPPESVWSHALAVAIGLLLALVIAHWAAVESGACVLEQDGDTCLITGDDE